MSAYQAEWATDVMLNNPRALAAIYPPLVQHAMNHFKNPDVMRLLGHPGQACSSPPPWLQKSRHPYRRPGRHRHPPGHLPW